MFVCLGFSLCYQRDTSFSHTWISVIVHVTFSMAALLSFWGVLLFPCMLYSLFSLCMLPHTACQQDTAVWSPCGSSTLGMGAWNGSCTLNKCSLKATRYLHLPWGWELMETQVWKCSGFPASSSPCGAQGKLLTSFRSGHWFIPGYQNVHHPDPNTPFQPWFLPRETNFHFFGIFSNFSLIPL